MGRGQEERGGEEGDSETGKWDGWRESCEQVVFSIKVIER